MIDIIVPTLNEAHGLGAVLAALESAASGVATVYVADGGSRDGTLDVARAHGATVLANLPQGRGMQLRAGFEAGRGDIVLMLHADTVLPPNALERISAAFAADAALEWGILGVRFDRRFTGLTILEQLNDLRFRCMGLAFGDQGIFARRQSIAACGGIPAIPLMEDVELSLRLRRGRRRHLACPLVASARRWEQRSVAYGALCACMHCARYIVLRQCGADINRLATRLYARYYGRHAPSEQRGSPSMAEDA